MPENKTSNFLKAIKKYAKEQKNAMKDEVAQLKTERLNEAMKKANEDSKRLIKNKLGEKRNEQTALLASKTQEGKKKLFLERVNMTEEIFRLCAEKLTAYTETEEYSSKLIQSAVSIAQLFGGKDCVVYLSNTDMKRADDIKAVFKGNTEIKVDKTIKIGGIKGYCESMGIIADETLDSKLEAQREWFTENSTLSVQ